MLDIEKLEKQLFEMQDLKYRDFHSKLLPGIDKETLIGIRTPMLRKFAKEFAKTPEAEEFLQVLPHRYYEENNMHMMEQEPLPVIRKITACVYFRQENDIIAICQHRTI